jgi:hypothetical protein
MDVLDPFKKKILVWIVFVMKISIWFYFSFRWVLWQKFVDFSLWLDFPNFQIWEITRKTKLGKKMILGYIGPFGESLVIEQILEDLVHIGIFHPMVIVVSNKWEPR